MKTRQIRTLHAILATGSVSRAAEMLNVSQPAISKTLRSLEEEIGYKLFRRVKGHLEPMPEATFLFDEVDQALRGLSRLEDMVRNAPRDLPESLIIASLPGPSNFLVPQLLQKYFDQRPPPKITLTSRSSPTIRELASTQQIDIGVLLDPPDSPNYTTERLRIEYVCGFPASDPLAKKKTISAHDLDGRPLILTGSDDIEYSLVRESFYRAGATFNPKYETPIYLPGLGLALSGFGVAIIDTLTAWTYDQAINARGLAFRPFVPPIHDRLAIISPALRPLSQTALEFRQMLTEGIRKISSFYSSETQNPE